MSEILKISEAASLALHTMVYMVENQGKKVTTAFVAASLNASEAHLSKVLQRLAKVGLVKSIRGPKGGFILGKQPQTITLLDVFEAIEGPFQPNDCLLDTPVCAGQCILGDLLGDINRQVREYLAGKRLDQLQGYFGCMVTPEPEEKGQGSEIQGQNTIL